MSFLATNTLVGQLVTPVNPEGTNVSFQLIEAMLGLWSDMKKV